MPYKKGMTKTGGRDKGVLNKHTKTLKVAFIDVFHKFQEHPRYNLYKWGSENLTEYYKLARSIIPIEVEGSINHKIIQVGYTDDLTQDSYTSSGAIDYPKEQKEI